MIDSKSVSITEEGKVEICNLNIAREILLTSAYYPNRPIKMSFKIIYEDENTIVVNKNSGITVEPEGINHGLVNFVTEYIASSSQNPFSIPRPVHRIDKDTSGLVIFSKSLPAHRYYSKLFKEHDLVKTYVAKVKGDFNNYLDINAKKLPLTIETYVSDKPFNRKYYSTSPDKGKIAITIIKDALFNTKTNASTLEIEIKTGRTHQIRIHLSEIGYPIIGDEIYSQKPEIKSKMDLVAKTIEIKPFGINETRKFTV